MKRRDFIAALAATAIDYRWALGEYDACLGWH
jgi:hypothetical protein